MPVFTGTCIFFSSSGAINSGFQKRRAGIILWDKLHPMDINTDIEKQVNAGFTRQEIVNNLLAKGHTQEEINKAYSSISAAPVFSETGSSVSTGSILLGILFIIIVIFRIYRYTSSNGGSAGKFFAFLSIFTGIALAIYYFTRKK